MITFIGAYTVYSFIHIQVHPVFNQMVRLIENQTTSFDFNARIQNNTKCKLFLTGI